MEPEEQKLKSALATRGGVVRMRGSVAVDTKKQVQFDKTAEAIGEMASNRMAARASKPSKPQIPGTGPLDPKHRSQLWVNMAKERAKKAKEALTAPLAGVWAAVVGNDAGETHIELPVEDQPDMLDIMDHCR